MNRRVFIMVEGQTEEAFVREILQPWFTDRDIHDVRAVKIQTSRGHKGGFVNYEHLKNDNIRLLRGEGEVVVTTLVDYFRIPSSIPNFELCHQRNITTAKKITCLEQAISDDLRDRRFFPYIQQHEFEALLFSSNAGFERFFDSAVHQKTAVLVNEFDNPEDINSDPTTAPSKRILQILPDYEKVNDGNIIALEIGIECIRQRCPRFKLWLDFIVASAKG